MSRARPKSYLAYYVLAAFVAASIAALFVFAPTGHEASADATPPGGLALTSALPDTVGKDTVLTVGDPVTQWIFEHNGWDRQLPFTIKWAEITGGPGVTEAFNAGALDVGVGANIPPIHATWASPTRPFRHCTIPRRWPHWRAR